MTGSKPTGDKPNPIEQQRVVHTPLGFGGNGKPVGAVNSVFQVAASAASKRPRLAPIDPMAVVIKSGVPIPPLLRGPGAVSPYRAVLERMKPGDCVEMPPPSGNSLASAAKKLNRSVTVRRLDNGLVGVWLNN